MRPISLCSWGGCGVLAVAAGAFGEPPSFQGLGLLPGQNQSRACALSADGSVVVGESGNTAFRWTANGGMVVPGYLQGGTTSRATGVSADGSVVVGRTSVGGFRWTSAAGMSALGPLQSGFSSYPNAVSADGSIVVGFGGNAAGTSDAARWADPTGWITLDYLPSYYAGEARAVSADGSVVVGVSQTVEGGVGIRQACRWTAATGVAGLGFLPGPNATYSEAAAVSADGTVVVGVGNSAYTGNTEAFRWTAGTGLVGLGLQAGLPYRSEAFGVSGDGGTVVGGVYFPSGYQVVVWGPNGQARRLRDILLAVGVTSHTEWSGLEAAAISADGTTVVGFGVDPAGLVQAFRAVIPADCQSAQWSQAQVSEPSGRADHAMVLDPERNRVVLFGGQAGAVGYFGDTWEFDGLNWALRNPPSGPSSRSHAAIVFDAQRHRSFLFGGWDGTAAFQDVWVWDGLNWSTPPTTGDSPSPRYDHVMAADTTRGVIVLFGGSSGTGGGVLGDTWEWNGISWTQRTGSSPPARTAAAMAFDSRRNRCVLFGGYDGSYTYLGDTWEWDGVSWISASAAGPSPRANHVLAFDESYGVVVLHGGGVNPGHPTDAAQTWTYDGSVWRLVSTSGPPGLSAHAMCQSPAGDGLSLFGGFQNGNYVDESWLLQFDPRIVTQPPSTTVHRGEFVQFSVAAIGTGTVGYQWRRDGINLSESSRIWGTTTSTLHIDNVQPDDSGTFTVVVTCDCGATTSRGAVLSVVCRADWNKDQAITPADIGAFVTDWFTSVMSGTLAGDFDRNGTVSPADIGAFVSAWHASLEGSCPP